jgi:hypothetical protein
MERHAVGQNALAAILRNSFFESWLMDIWGVLEAGMNGLQ